MLKMVLLGLLMVGAVVVASLYTVSSQAVAPPSARSATPTTAAAVSPTLRPGDIRVTLTDQQASDALNAAVVGQPLGQTPFGAATLSAVTVHFTPGQFTLGGQAAVGEQSVPVSGTGTADVEGGQVAVHVQQAQLAGIDLPASFRQSLNDTLQSQLDNALTTAGVRVSSITLESGQLVAVGSRA